MVSNPLENETCREVQGLISDYVDNILPARQSWDVEKHIAGCDSCAALADQLQKTVALLRHAERFDTSDDFMARFHARLDTVEPQVTRPHSLVENVKDWLAQKRLQRMSGFGSPGGHLLSKGAFGLGVAALAAGLMLFAIRPQTSESPMSVPPPAVPQEALARHAAVTASNPFDDPVAAKLEADAGSPHQELE